MAGKSKESPASERIIREFRRATADSANALAPRAPGRGVDKTENLRPMLGAPHMCRGGQ